MKFNRINSRAHLAKVFLFILIPCFGPYPARPVDQPSREEHIPVVAQGLPGDIGPSLTAVIVKLAPGATVASHRHLGIVSAYVPKGTLRPQLNGGQVIEYRAGQSWVEALGSEHTLAQNPSRRLPTRLRAVFIAPKGAQLTPHAQ
jgi:quercetin dioxygenase-like cupin family protein